MEKHKLFVGKGHKGNCTCTFTSPSQVLQSTVYVTIITDPKEVVRASHPAFAGRLLLHITITALANLVLSSSSTTCKGAWRQKDNYRIKKEFDQFSYADAWFIYVWRLHTKVDLATAFGPLGFSLMLLIQSYFNLNPVPYTQPHPVSTPSFPFQSISSETVFSIQTFQLRDSLHLSAF